MCARPVLSGLQVPRSGPWVRLTSLGWLQQEGSPQPEPGPPCVRCGKQFNASPRQNGSLLVLGVAALSRACGWDPWLGRIPLFEGKRNKMSLLVPEESAIINMICLFFKVRDVPKKLRCREVEAPVGGTFPKADLHVWQSLDERLGVLALFAKL